MRRKPLFAATAVAAALAMTASACGSSSSGTSSSGGGSTTGASATGYNAAVSSIVNASTDANGTVTYDNAQTFDSTDPGNTYYAFSWDFDRLYARTVLSFVNAPGAAGLKLEGDLATGLGAASDNNTVWTYHIVGNAKFSDGTTITTSDIKYAIERSNWGHAVLDGGPDYFAQLIQDNTKYKGPYVDKNASDGVSGITTPDATTITFKLTEPFADFNYLMTLLQTSPIERSKDTGATYYEHQVTSGAYTIQSYTPNKQLTLVPEANFVSASDPNGLHKVVAKKIIMNLGQNPQSIDQNLLHGDATIDATGTGVQDQTQGSILANPTLKADSDDADSGFVNYLTIDTTMAPFTNINCRQSVEYAINKLAIQTAAGGEDGGGDIATTLLPPNNLGYAASNQYPTPDNEGNITKAQSLLATCKSQLQATNSWSDSDLSFGLSTWSDQPKMVAAIAVVQQDLKQVGYNVTVTNHPSNTFFENYSGLPSYEKANRVAISYTGWGADFPTTYGFMYSILTPAGIVSSGGSYNLSYWTSPTFENLLTATLTATSTTAEAAAGAAADQYALSQAVVVPVLYDRVLLYRPTSATNVLFDQAYGMYDYPLIGSTTN
jgi:peptide/nickel transport system substrate-binding protein